jgi:ribose transport system permease protein
LGSAQPTAGTGYEIDAIAAVVIGGATLSGGRGGIVGTVLGALILGALKNGLSILNVSSYTQQVFVGVIIVAAVLLDLKRLKGVRYAEN